MKHTEQELMQAVVQGNEDEAARLVQELVTAGFDPLVIVNDALIPAMERVGVAFEDGEAFLPDILLAAQAMQGGMAILRPHIESHDSLSRGTVVIGTVREDQHDIGKNLVAVMLEGAGFTVIDLGCDVAPERFIAEARRHRADIIAMSALLNTTMRHMRAVIEQISGEGDLEDVKVLVGGAPVTEDYAAQIGAQGWAPDAVSAVRVATTLCR